MKGFSICRYSLPVETNFARASNNFLLDADMFLWFFDKFICEIGDRTGLSFACK